MLHPTCFTTSWQTHPPHRTSTFPLAVSVLYCLGWSCYSTPLSSPWLEPQVGVRSLIPSTAPQCPWELEAAAVQELALKESWLGPHVAPPHWAQGGGMWLGMAVVRSCWPRSKGHFVSVIF